MYEDTHALLLGQPRVFVDYDLVIIIFFFFVFFRLLPDPKREVLSFRYKMPVPWNGPFAKCFLFNNKKCAGTHVHMTCARTYTRYYSVYTRVRAPHWFWQGFFDNQGPN